jgi:putative RNA 2'-phosphotransferase
MNVMESKRLIRISKYLSRHLRHAPEDLGLTLAPGGWVDVDALLAACRKSGLTITRADLDEVVANNDKQRFSFDDSGTRIRANQGQTVEVDLQLEPAEPPALLYHGTGHGLVASIRRDGLCKMRRHHVHLSADTATAMTVGRRRGMPVVFVVDAAAMHRAGFVFYRSDNGVWLVDAVPVEYLKLQGGE